nr:hypothetical protein [Dyadobacter chenwenxiniae]
MTDSTISKRQILSPLQTSQKIRRIAFEIYEHNFEETPALSLQGLLEKVMPLQNDSLPSLQTFPLYM